MKENLLKQRPDLAIAGVEPQMVQVPTMKFLVIEGKGAVSSPEYTRALIKLYSTVYGIKMGGYEDFEIPPLEMMWWGEPTYVPNNPNSWRWNMMLRVPDYVTQEWLTTMGIDIRLDSFTEGICAQAVHVGSYTDPSTQTKIVNFLSSQKFKRKEGNFSGLRHDIYLTDPRTTEEAELKTVVRLLVG